jgi:hypothetical protein
MTDIAKVRTPTALTLTEIRQCIQALSLALEAHTHERDDITDFAHATTHQSGGADAIKLDDLATPDDNTDLNASTTRHGLMPKLSNVATEYYDGTGAWSVPAGDVNALAFSWMGF